MARSGDCDTPCASSRWCRGTTARPCARWNHRWRWSCFRRRWAFFGLGSFEADLSYRDNGLVIIRHLTSPFPGIFAAEAGGACPILSGFHAAILSYLAGRQLAAREVHCSREPGDECLFVVATEERLTKLLIATPGSADHDLLAEITSAEDAGIRPMSDKKKDRRSTLADALDATHWDHKPGKDRKILLRPIGSVFGELPWEIQPQYLGPAPSRTRSGAGAESEAETDTDDDADTQPIKPLKK